MNEKIKNHENELSYIDKRNEDFFNEMEYDEKTKSKMRKKIKKYRTEEANKINKIQLQRKKERDKEIQSPEHLFKIIAIFGICILGYMFLS